MIPGSSLQGPFTASRAHRRDVSACGRLAAGPRRPHEAGVHLHRAVNGRVARHSLSQPDIQKGWPVADWYSQSQNRDRIPRSRVNRSSFKSAVPSRERTHTDEARHGGCGARDRLRDGAAEGGGGGVGARAAEEARRREGGAPAPALHAAVLRRRQRRGDAEDPGRGGRGERGRGLGRRLRRRLPVLRVAGRLHRELPQEPGLRDHLRPPRHGGVRGGGGGGADDGQLAVQEAGRDGDRGGGGGVRGRGGLRGGVRVGLQRAQQDRPDVHAGVQRLRRLPHRQHRGGALLRGRAPGLVRRHMSMHVYTHKD